MESGTAESATSARFRWFAAADIALISARPNACEDAIRNQQFLAAAHFPKATVQKETEGYSVELRDLKFDVLGQTSRVVEADINLDNSCRVTFAHLEWRGQPRKN